MPSITGGPIPDPIPETGGTVRVKLTVDDGITHSGPVKIGSETVAQSVTVSSSGTPNTRYVNGVSVKKPPGFYDVTWGGEWLELLEVEPATDGPTAEEAETFDGSADSGTVSGGSVTERDRDVDPSDYVGVVNADNSTGAALAPALRRRGVEVDDVGASATFGGTEFEIVDEGTVSVGGDRIDVGDVTDSDEAARVISGPNTGAPVATDSDVVDDGGLADGGLLGLGLAGLLALGGAAVLFGGGE
jgi:hypothetical protein